MYILFLSTFPPDPRLTINCPKVPQGWGVRPWMLLSGHTPDPTLWACCECVGEEVLCWYFFQVLTWGWFQGAATIFWKGIWDPYIHHRSEVPPSGKHEEWCLPCWLNGKESTCNAGDMGSILEPGRFHMPQSNKVSAPQLLSLCSAATVEARMPGARAVQQEKPQQWEVASAHCN